MNAQTFDLSARLTRRYTQGWASEDRHMSLGTYAITDTADGQADRNGDRDRYLRIAVNSKARPANVCRALADSLSFGCRCEHDCCGHMQGSVSEVLPLRNGHYLVIQSLYTNV